MKKPRIAVTWFALMAAAISCKTSPFASARVPMKHRAASQDCPHERGSRPEPAALTRGPSDQCTKDADCTQKPNGRCFVQRGGARCSYDACYSDTDCAGGPGEKGSGTCECRSSATSVVANTCKWGNCRTDADCHGNYCSPSLGTCGHMGGIVGYFCHARKDECIDDSDCKGKDDKSPRDGACRYVEEVGHFKCSTMECVG